ncbi:HEAT repeat domain-containing protein [Tautonia marina]|uniref:HEAT repeat domain-containing protein n=1 Tax=Tautonia marina TaxID=2653855 RepID=UPI001260FF2A|nr:HEAT repeat domain-containing protein [Tautonia marina]
MSVQETYLTYRGEIRALASSGKWLAFVTEHPEQRPTAVYRLDCESLTLATDPLPTGAKSICLIGDDLWIGGTDGVCYRGSLQGGAPGRSLTIEGGPLSALVPLAENRLAIASGQTLTIADIKKSKPAALQTLDLPAEITCLACDPTGLWLVAGTSKGDVSVFSAEGREDFLLSESSKLHEGAVSALRFEPDELRFLSAGADRKLLSTLARGTLEPEDRGKSNTHEDVITRIVWAPGDRFLTGSRDSTVKTWPRTGGSRPATLKDGVAKVRDLAIVTVHERPRLVIACEDNTLRLVVLDAAGKFGDATARIYDGLARARHELSQSDPRRREAALVSLTEAGDSAAVELLAEHCRADTDPDLRLDAARRLGQADHSRVVPLLEGLLDHPDERVRVLAFEQLRARTDAADFRPIDLALKTDHPEIGRLAVQALEPLARRDEQALDRLLATLDARQWEVRRSAAEALEAIHAPDAPEADLIALGSKHADLRRWALVRLLQRGLLDRSEVATALRRRSDDRDADVRRVAFLLLLHTRPRLLDTLRQRDPDLDRQLNDLATDPGGPGQGGTTEVADSASDPKPKGKARAAKSPKPSKKAASEAVSVTDLDADDLAPLLNASASRSLDTSLRGARGLALLGDPRAFGLLLQLSREADATARVEVCRALAALGDDAARHRLRSLVHDEAPEVRDAAFSALASIDHDAPLLAAEAGLNADHDDVRRRGLQLLLAEARKAPPKSADDPIGRLLVRALNDGSPPIRAEAFKASLNLPVAGGGAGALRFTRQSIHTDVRREVLTEVLAQLAQPWAWDLLLEVFDDPDSELRADAFAAASTKAKGLDVLEAALGARFADVRAKAVAALVKKHSARAHAILARAIDDEDRDVRLAAIDALVSNDARSLLASALAAPHADVRVRAARALARHGDRAALGPLISLAAAPEPTESERLSDWLDLAGLALNGLAELGDAEAVLPVLPLLDSTHPPLRKGAAEVLVWCVDSEAIDPLRQALSHADLHVKYRAAMGLALRGDASTAPLIDSAEGTKVLSRDDRLAAAVALGDPGEGRVVLTLDDENAAIRDRALLLLMLREHHTPRGDADRLIAALSSRSPRVRLVAADALQSAHDRAALLATITRLINDRDDQTAWTISETTVNTLADLLVLAPPIVQARGVIRLLPLLGPDEKEQAAFELACTAFAQRFGSSVTVTPDNGSHARSDSIPALELRARAFGAYVGLVREQAAPPASGRSKKRQATANPAAEAAIVRVRRAALDRLRSLAIDDPSLAAASVPVMLQALADPNQVVRFTAFDHLHALGTDSTLLGAEALGAGPTDVGVRGLELLSGSKDDPSGQSVLEQVMMTRKDNLATEAARLLGDRLGRAVVATRALDAASEPLRLLAVSWLREFAESDPKALTALRGALESRFAAVRRSAAFALAERHDPAAFEALVRLLNTLVEPRDRQNVIAAFDTLGDPRAAGVFLDLIDTNASGTASAEVLIPAAAKFRRPDDSSRLLAFMERLPKARMLCFQAVLAISGYDQPVADPQDERPNDRRWMESQHPRRDAILASLLDRCLTLGETRLIQRAITPARWALGSEVNEPLGLASTHPEEWPRREAIEALGWRLRKRNGPADPLLKALQHPDPVTQFLAAEGLALGARTEGISVLLSAVDYLSDLALRRRAVVALGELEDPRAFDRILQLAGESGHALQDVAAEALGHLGRGPRSADVFKLLDRQSRSSGSVAAMALRGLRWLGTREAWARIREVASTEHDRSDLVPIALDLLAFDDETATRDLLLRQLREATWPDYYIALRSARNLFGPESIEPDEAAVQNPFDRFGSGRFTWSDLQKRFDIPLAEPLERLREHADPARLFALIPRCSETNAKAIGAILLDLPEPPLTEARAAIDSESAPAVATAAHILGRTKDAKSGPNLASALSRWTTIWTASREAARRVETRVAGPCRDDEARLLATLAWAAGRTESAVDELLQLIALELASDPDQTDPRILRSAVEALTLFASPPPAVLDILATLAREGPADLRTLATDALARFDPKRASTIASDLIGDPVGFDRLSHHLSNTLDGPLTEAAPNLHAQGVALPQLVARGHLDPLATVAVDRSLPDAARLGAVEALAALASESAEEHLRAVGLDAANDEALRKGAWRALRRSRRLRDRSRNPRRHEVTP